MLRIMQQRDRKINGMLIIAVFSMTLLSLGCLLFAGSFGCRAIAAPSLPDPAALRDGDIVWPKESGVIVPFFDLKDTGIINAYNNYKKQWEKEKEEFVRLVRNSPTSSDYERRTADQLEKTTFEEFTALYFGEGADWRSFVFDYRTNARGLRLYGAGIRFPIYVGHVGMIFTKDGAPWVVDAAPPVVRELPYTDWLFKYEGADVWLGRFKNIDTVKIVEIARGQKGKPYSLFNKDLSDNRQFYCSKLIWFSVFRATGISLDGDTNPARSLWFTPKQLINLKEHISLIYKPGVY